jgi:hypothetical protein
METIKCFLRPVNKEDKKGRYSQTMHWDVPGFGKNKWVAIGYLDVDWVAMEKDGLSKEEIVEICISFLNTAPPRKKYAKKEPRPPYGKIERYKEKWIDDGDPHVIFEFITDDPSNENFIGTPPKLLSGKKG